MNMSGRSSSQYNMWSRRLRSRSPTNGAVSNENTYIEIFLCIGIYYHYITHKTKTNLRAQSQIERSISHHGGWLSVFLFIPLLIILITRTPPQHLENDI